MFGFIAKLVETGLKQAGIIGKGKGTSVAAGGVVVGIAASLLAGDDVFAALHTLIDLVRQGIGPATIVISAILGLFTVGRKAGAKGAKE